MNVEKKKLYTKAALKVVPPIFLFWSMTSEADVGHLAIEVEPSHQYSITFCCCAMDGSRGAVWHGSAHEAKICHVISPCGRSRTDIHQFLLKVYGDRTVTKQVVGGAGDSGSLCWHRFLRAQHLGSCSLHSYWWWLCWKCVFYSWEFALWNSAIVTFLNFPWK